MQRDPSGDRKIAVFISFSGQGGVERMVNNLARGLTGCGYEVDMVMARATGEHVEGIAPEIHQIRLGTRHTLTGLPGLVRYLVRNRPAAILAVKDRAIKVAVMARWFSGSKAVLVGRLGTTVSAAIEGRGRIRRWAWYWGMRTFYRHVDRIVAVSHGVAEDVRAITGLPESQVAVVRNPVVTPDLHDLAGQKVDHPWVGDRDVPLILGVGRLTHQKDFATLIRAFSIVRSQRPCRLLILGEGRKRGDLQSTISSLGLGADAQLPGFVPNPYAYLAGASLFVLSSIWEGSPNALTESLALGVPVVSTDCPSGPREILQNGRYGTLVPMGDASALARAMLDTLSDPLHADFLKGAVVEYALDRSVAGYLDALGLGNH